MKSSNKAALIGGSAIAAYLVIAGLCVYGWVANIVTLFHADFARITGALVLRCIGIVVAPVGIVMGYL